MSGIVKLPAGIKIIFGFLPFDLINSIALSTAV
jgi:hypothetical protein